MLGSATFTIVMSTSSMNVVAQTAISVQRRSWIAAGKARRLLPAPRASPDEFQPPNDVSGLPVSSSVFRPLRTIIQPWPETPSAVSGEFSSRSCVTVSRQ